VRNQHRVDDEHAWCIWMRLGYADSTTRLNEQSFIAFEILERRYDAVEVGPTSSGFATSTVHDQLVRIFSDFRVEVIHEHAHRSLLLPSFTGELGAAWSSNGPRCAVGCCRGSHELYSDPGFLGDETMIRVRFMA